MNIGQIQITSQKLTFNITSHKAQLNLHQQLPKMYVNRQEITKVRVTSHELPQFQVNWKKVWAESGLKSPMILANTLANESTQKGLENIASIVQQGDILMDFKNGDGVVRAAMNEMPLDHAEVNIGLMPQSMPEVSWTDGNLALDWTDPELDVSWDTGGADLTVSQHSVEIKIRDFPEVRITYQGKNPGIGREIDHKI